LGSDGKGEALDPDCARRQRDRVALYERAADRPVHDRPRWLRPHPDHRHAYPAGSGIRCSRHGTLIAYEREGGTTGPRSCSRSASKGEHGGGLTDTPERWETGPPGNGSSADPDPLAVGRLGRWHLLHRIGRSTNARTVPFWLDDPARPEPTPSLRGDSAPTSRSWAAASPDCGQPWRLSNVSRGRDVVLVEGGVVAIGASASQRRVLCRHADARPRERGVAVPRRDRRDRAPGPRELPGDP